MSFDVKLDIKPAHDLLVQVRATVEAIQEDVRNAARGEIKDHVEQDVQTLLTSAPAQQNTYGFVFATERSRNYYLMARRKGFFPGQGDVASTGPWERNGNLENSWAVEVDERTVRVNTLMRIYNTAESENTDPNHTGEAFSKAVYGPDAVLGFVDMGWGLYVDDAVDEIVDHVTEDLQNVLDRALRSYHNADAGGL